MTPTTYTTPLQDRGDLFKKYHLPRLRVAACADCDEVFDSGLPVCPACGSSTLFSLAGSARRPMRIAIVGHGLAGKDEAGSFLPRVSRLRYDPDWCSTSLAIFEEVKARGVYPGLSDEETYAMRRVDRETWFKIGREICSNNPTALVERCLDHGDIVTGIRAVDELMGTLSRGLVNLVVWIDSSTRVPPDPTVQFGPEACQVVIPNNGTLAEFHARLDVFGRCLR